MSNKRNSKVWATRIRNLSASGHIVVSTRRASYGTTSTAVEYDIAPPKGAWGASRSRLMDDYKKNRRVVATYRLEPTSGWRRSASS